MADKKVVFDVLARMREQGSDNVRKRINLVAVAAGALAVKFGIDSVKAYTEAEAKQNQLQQAYKKFPKLADTSLKSLEDLNSAQELKTKFDDDETASAESVLAQYKLTGSQLKSLVPLMQDYAARTGKDLPTAARDLGKAMLGQGKALKGIGINFKDTGSTAGNFNELMKGLRTQVGGFAESEGKTASGRAKILSNEFGEFKEQVGKSAVTLGQKLLPPLIKGADWLQRNWSVLKPFVIGLVGFATTVYVVSKAMGAWSQAQKVLNLVIGANPYVRIAILIIAIGTALVAAYKHSETFRNVVKGVFSAVQTAARALALAFNTVFLQPLLTVFGAVVHGAASAFGWVPGLGGKLRAARDAFDTFRAGVNSAIDKIRGVKKIKVVPDYPTAASTESWLNSYLNRLAGKTNDFRFYLHPPNELPTIPGAHRAGGGSVYRGQSYVVGERRPELFTPSENGRVSPRVSMGGSAGGTVVLEIRSGGSPMDELLAQLLRKYVRVNGGSVQAVLGT